jgi:serine/threonine protein kinase
VRKDLGIVAGSMDTPAAEEDFATRWIGQELDGRYRIVELLAAGGMGAVFVADHLTLPKQVAIKMIRDNFANNETAEARFKQEALATARIDHPHVVSAIDYGRLPGGGTYLVIQLVRGISLWQKQEAGPMPWRQACQLGVQIADALAAAHAVGIIHRDLKPENILLESRADGSLHTRVVDFGLAHVSAAAGPGTEPRKLTRIGSVLGTPGYMAPEQTVGEAIDERADLYALGVILWECCSGLYLWNSDSIIELRRLQLSAPARSLREACPDTVPEALASLVDRLLARKAAERPETAAVVRDELRALVVRAELGPGAVGAQSAVRPAIAAAASAYASSSATAATATVSAATSATVTTETPKRGTVTTETPKRGAVTLSVLIIAIALLVFIGAYAAGATS